MSMGTLEPRAHPLELLRGLKPEDVEEEIVALKSDAESIRAEIRYLRSLAKLVKAHKPPAPRAARVRRLPLDSRPASNGGVTFRASPQGVSIKQRVAEYLVQHGPSRAANIAEDVGLELSQVMGTLRNCPVVFEESDKGKWDMKREAKDQLMRQMAKEEP